MRTGANLKPLVSPGDHHTFLYLFTLMLLPKGIYQEYSPNDNLRGFLLFVLIQFP